jgi:hypothetical protein
MMVRPPRNNSEEDEGLGRELPHEVQPAGQGLLLEASVDGGR